VLEALQTQYRNLSRALATLEADKRQYLHKAEEVRAYASKQLFGFEMRSAPPISLDAFTAIPDGLSWFFQPAHWLELGHALQGTVARQPLLSIGILLAAVLLFLTRRRIGAALVQTGVKVRRISTDRFAHTGEALFWTFLLALPIPLLIGLAGWALSQAPEPGTWLQSMANGLRLAAWISLLLAFLAAVCYRNGLGSVHFRWQAKPQTRLRRLIYRFAVIYIPALLISFGGVDEAGLDYLANVGRISFMLAYGWMAIILWQLLNFSDGVLATFIREKPESLLARWRYLWFPLVLACPLALVIIAGLGYLFTAFQLSLGLLETIAYIAAGTVLYRLARRWFRIKERALALAKALEKRRARQETATLEEQSVDVVSVDPEDEEALDMVSITEQTRHLLRLIFGLGVAVAILLAWSKYYQIIATLDTISIPLTGGLTLLALMQAVLIGVVTYIAAHNLPGLLELAALRSTAIEAGTRNAISTLSQYAVVAVGITLLLNVLNVDWTKFGWIAAALSVGIGFGLQEVVANFVCGLILLFERPIRVGDFVTVSGTTGTVTKIRIRATTITTGDRQDFLVPNKTLITSAVLNWTLEAAVNRITIRLGVADGTDIEKARRILLAVATDHPLVLDNPAPRATFEEFGDSSLNLVLYAFLPDIASRTGTISDLHTEIDKRFAAAGIAIPNPQLDLHLFREGKGGRDQQLHRITP
jgi:potassium efflux system protein